MVAERGVCECMCVCVWCASLCVNVSLCVHWSPTSGSVLTAQSLEPASDSLSPCLSASPLLALCLSQINIKKKN